MSRPTQPSSKALSVLIVSCVVCPGQHNHLAKLYQCCLCHVSCVQQGSISAACGVCRVSRPTQPSSKALSVLLVSCVVCRVSCVVCRVSRPTQPSSKALSVLLVSCVVCPARLYQCYLWRVSCVNSNTTTLQRDCMTALRCVHAGPHNLPELAIIQIEACSTHARCVLQNGQRMYHCRKPYHGD